MATPARPTLLARSADVGRLVATDRRRANLSQTEFAAKLGVSRKTLSDLERGAAEHLSLKTALHALTLAGFSLEASIRRPPTLAEVMARRAEHQARVDQLTESSMPHPPRRRTRGKDGRR